MFPIEPDLCKIEDRFDLAARLSLTCRNTILHSRESEEQRDKKLVKLRRGRRTFTKLNCNPTTVDCDTKFSRVIHTTTYLPDTNIGGNVANFTRFPELNFLGKSHNKYQYWCGILATTTA